MHNTFIIAKREYLERVRSRSFVIMTFFIPLLMFGVTVVPTLLMNRGSNETKHMVVVAGDRDTAEMIRSRIEQRQEKSNDNAKSEVKTKRGLPPTHFTVEVSTDTADSARAALTKKVKDKELDGFLWATPEAIQAQEARLCNPRYVQLYRERIARRERDRCFAPKRLKKQRTERRRH